MIGSLHPPSLESRQSDQRHQVTRTDSLHPPSLESRQSIEIPVSAEDFSLHPPSLESRQSSIELNSDTDISLHPPSLESRQSRRARGQLGRGAVAGVLKTCSRTRTRTKGANGRMRGVFGGGWCVDKVDRDNVTANVNRRCSRPDFTPLPQLPDEVGGV